MSSNPFAGTALAVVIATAASGAVHAADRIGKTAVSRNTVEEIARAPTQISVGDDVFTNELVRTGQESAAKFVFSDETNLAMGAVSTVKLDRFVYKGDTSYIKAAVNFTTGAFRFTTGASDKGAYQLKTSTASIGVRGTVFDLSATRTETVVTLIEGAIDVCPRRNYDGDPRRLSPAQLRKYQCVQLTRSGQTAVVTARRAAFRELPFSFAEATGCGDGLCTTTRFAELSGPTTPSLSGTLCYMKQDTFQ